MRDVLTGARWKVGAFLVVLTAVTYLDRICISVAGPRMQSDLHIGPVGWGWVTGVFGLAYCLFEIPSGALGDRIGARRVLTRIVLWWSLFTALTGSVAGFFPLLAVRFLFGVGEAGAFPNISIVISRWFAPSRRATMFGMTLMAAQFGGALTPLLVVPIQARYGWRASFFFLGALGVVWAVAWGLWFRDSPQEKLGLAGVAASAPSGERPPGHRFPWRSALRSSNVLALMLLAFCYIYIVSFFQTWFQTFLVKGRGFSEKGLLLSALPYAVAAGSNLLGGATSDALVRRWGSKTGRRAVGVPALLIAAACLVAVARTHDAMTTIILLAVAYGAITFQQSGACGVCLDISGRAAGSMFGLFNTASYLGALVGSVAYGYIVDRFGSYDAPFLPMAALLVLGAVLWLMIDASRQVVANPPVGAAEVPS
jgi:MFS transporter, ACS family, glucarate transporter